MIQSPLFYCKNKDTYPPFKNGLYLEEFFLKNTFDNNTQYTRKYIPALWTNFQIEWWFKQKKQEMQNSLNDWIKENPSPDGYFTVVQHDDACLLDLPENTIVYGSCSGHEILPLVYQDINDTLIKIPRKSFKDKSILCSFIGSNTSNNILPNVRKEMGVQLGKNPNFLIHFTNGWTPLVDAQKQHNFISATVNSKFALAPRGYGRSSFRFFEIFQLGSIPIYLWNDKEWLPFKDKIDYSKICISLNIKDIDKLENILLNITEEQYNTMYEEYNKIKHYFTVEGIYNYIKNKYKTN
tara:strand:- start:622 stop:1506 length:885 start_codon:yes stop_codon:yes gene_type:complete